MRCEIFAITMALVFASACRKNEAVEKPVIPVRTAVVEMNQPSTEIRYSGTVLPDTQVELAFRVSGPVEELGRIGGRELQEGDAVSNGAILARLRRAEYQSRFSHYQATVSDAAAGLSAQHAQLKEAEASLSQYSRDFQRASDLFAEKALTRADFDAAEARRDAAAARRDALMAQIEVQKARIEGAGAQTREAEVALGDTDLLAPFAGVIISKRISRGSFAAAGAPAFVLADTRRVKISFGVPDTALSGFHTGDQLTVRTEAIPNREFRGRISSIAAAADSSSRVFAVEVTIDNASQAMKTGMVATVIVAAEKQIAPAPVIPLTAVVKSGAGAGAYAVYAIENRDGGERARLQPVSLGEVRGNSVVITAGLKPGQRVIATGGLQIADGEPVRQIP